MKTVEELVEEYFTNNFWEFYPYDKKTAIECFIAGYNKAKEWISVDYELPEVSDVGYKILVRYENDLHSDLVYIYPGEECTKDYFIFAGITHWKYID